MLQTNITGVCLQYLIHAGLAPACGHTAQALCCSPREPPEAGPRLHAPPQSKPLRLGAQEALRSADLVGPAFCALPRSK
ncbi:hypothetical protein DJ52_11435 [Brachyspira murdochii]|uniref:Uncharacterized protein n=1 Tax=Brachyspira murdochii TaxID=84378 RepID=A0ABX5B3X7_9SPIR|nr:hypothetical protein DJ52_11435 [Brachyspira murdochii]